MASPLSKDLSSRVQNGASSAKANHNDVDSILTETSNQQINSHSKNADNVPSKISPFGHLSEAFIEKALLKAPGDYVVSQSHNDALRLSIMCESGNVIHLQIIQTKHHFHIKDTFYPSANSIHQLIQQFQQSQMNVLSAIISSEVVLRRAVQCNDSVTDKYDVCGVFIKDDSQFECNKFLCNGNTSKIFIGKLNLNGRREKVVIKEMSNYSAEELNRILMELHISNLMDRITDGCAVVRVMAVRLIKSPYLVIYPYINCRSYPDFASQYPSQLTSFDKINASESIAKTIVDMHSCGILHCNIGARNIFVRREIIRSNSNDQLLPEFTFLLGDFRKAVIAKSKSVDPMKPVNLRWLAPEVFKTKCLNSSTDVYAFGMTLYEIFTGNVPYYTRTAQEIRRKIIAGEYFRPGLNFKLIVSLGRDENSVCKWCGKLFIRSILMNWNNLALNKTLNEDLCELMRKCWLEEASERPSMKDVWMHLTRIHDSIIETIISP